MMIPGEAEKACPPLIEEPTEKFSSPSPIGRLAVDFSARSTHGHVRLSNFL